MELVCLHAKRFCEHPLSVFEAILKYARRALSKPVLFYFLPDGPLLPARQGRRYRLRLIFPHASDKDIQKVQEAVLCWLKEPRRHFSATFEEPVSENVESAVLALPCPADAEDIRLDFLSPLQIPDKGRAPDVRLLVGLILDRLEKLSGPIPQRQALLDACGHVRLIPHDWEYREYRHASKSSGGTQFINGFQGRIILSGKLSPLMPLIAAGARIGCGLRLGFGLGSFQPAGADMLHQALTSPPTLLSALQFLNSHGYGLDEGCIHALRQSVENGGPLSREEVLLAQEVFFRLLQKPVKHAFPLARAEATAHISWQTLQQCSLGSEGGLGSLLTVLSKADHALMPLVRTLWLLDGIPQMADLRVRARAGEAVREAASLGISARLTTEGILLDDPAEQGAMRDILARQGIVITDAVSEDSPTEEEQRLTPWKRNLHIIHPGAAIGLDSDAVIARYDGETLLRTPLGQVSALILHGSGSVSTPLMRRCIKEDIPIILCESGGRLTGSITPQSPSWRKRGRDHIKNWERLGDAGRFFMAREIIIAKVENYLCKLPRGMEAPQSFRIAGQKTLAKVHDCASPQELLGVEGAFARVAFRAYNNSVVNDAFRSAHRQPRCGQDIWNTALDTASFLTFQRIAMELVAEGLDPFLGIFHCQNLRYMTFAADIQELFRADVERWLLRIINQNILREEHFSRENGRFRLTQEGWRLFLLQWEAGLQIKFGWQPDSPARSLSRQVRSMRLWLCSGVPPELYTGSGWRPCNRAAFFFS